MRKIGDVSGGPRGDSTSALGVRQPQQCADTDRGGREHGDLAHRVEAAKVDQDDVDDVASVAERGPELGEILAQPRRRLGRRDRQHQSANQRADAGSNEERRGSGPARGDRAPRFLKCLNTST